MELEIGNGIGNLGMGIEVRIEMKWNYCIEYEFSLPFSQIPLHLLPFFLWCKFPFTF